MSGGFAYDAAAALARIREARRADGADRRRGPVDLSRLSQVSQPSQAPGLRPEDLSEHERDTFEERAAILEYDQGLSREAAEAAAIASLANR